MHSINAWPTNQPHNVRRLYRSCSLACTAQFFLVWAHKYLTTMHSNLLPFWQKYWQGRRFLAKVFAMGENKCRKGLNGGFAWMARCILGLRIRGGNYWICLSTMKLDYYVSPATSTDLGAKANYERLNCCLRTQLWTNALQEHGMALLVKLLLKTVWPWMPHWQLHLERIHANFADENNFYYFQSTVQSDNVYLVVCILYK